MNNKTFYIIFQAKDCTPNGDPDTNEQRYDEQTKKAIVTHMRVKRFARNEMIQSGLETFYEYDHAAMRNISAKGSKTDISGSAARFKHFLAEKKIKIKDISDINSFLAESFLDMRSFGGLLTDKPNPGSVSGCIILENETQSLNTIEHGNRTENAITSILPSKISNGQGSMGQNTFIKYSLFSTTGKLDARKAEINGLTEDEFNLVLMYFWEGIKNLKTTSKDLEPIAIVVADHPTLADKSGKRFGLFFDPFNLKLKGVETTADIRSDKDFGFDFTPLKEVSNKRLEKITVFTDDDNIDFIEEFNGFDVDVEIKDSEDEFQRLKKLSI